VELTEIDLGEHVADRHLSDLMELFAGQWWTSARTRDQVVALLDASDVVVAAVHRPHGRLIGFARVLTDETALAVVLDVMVAPDWRRQGIGSLVMDFLVQHPRLAQVESIELVCQPDVMPFYREWGFTDAVGASRLMRRTSNAALLGDASGPPERAI
jgi:GNAT superfamily N-acetyltransferase